MAVAGRNSKPDHDGPAGHPARLDAYGTQQAQEDKQRSRRRKQSACDIADDKQ